MKKQWLPLMITLATLLAGCNTDELTDPTGTPTPKKMITIHVGTSSDEAPSANGKDGVQTRVSYDDANLKLTWDTGDKLTVAGYDDANTLVATKTYDYTGTPGETSGSFTGTEITGAVRYTVTYLNASTSTQTADKNTAHLKSSMKLFAETTNLGNFTMTLQSTIMKFSLSNIPTEVGKLKSLTWMLGSHATTLNFAADAVTFNASKTDLTAYLSFDPKDFEAKTGDTFRMTLIGDKTYTTTVTMSADKTYNAGSRYTATLGTEAGAWKELVSMSWTIKTSKTGGSGETIIPSFSLPFPITGTTPANHWVDWGDGSFAEIPTGTTLAYNDAFNHTYPQADSYTITFYSDQTDETQQQMPPINFKNNRTNGYNSQRLISINTPLLNTGATDFNNCFWCCYNLTTIPAGLFDKHTQVTNFSNCFNYCQSLTTIPAGLFDKNTQATNFNNCFSYCQTLTTIPAGLFDQNALATNFSYCFTYCRALTTIPNGLFDKNTQATNFQNCFSNCRKVRLNKFIFDSQGNLDRFKGKYIDFRSCFLNAGASNGDFAQQGEAPELWKYEKANQYWNTTDCFENAWFRNSTVTYGFTDALKAVWGNPNLTPMN